MMEVELLTAILIIQEADVSMPFKQITATNMPSAPTSSMMRNANCVHLIAATFFLVLGDIAL